MPTKKHPPRRPSFRPPKALRERSQNIFDRIVGHLESRPEASTEDLAEIAGTSKKNIENIRWLANLRLSADQHPARIVPRTEGKTVYWRLRPIPLITP